MWIYTGISLTGARGRRERKTALHPNPLRPNGHRATPKTIGPNLKKSLTKAPQRLP